MRLTTKQKHKWGWSTAQMSATNQIGSQVRMTPDGQIVVRVELVPEECDYMVTGDLRVVRELITRGDEMGCAWKEGAKPGATGQIRVVSMRCTYVDVKVTLVESEY